MKPLLLPLLAFALAVPASAQSITLSADARGVVIDGGSSGRITLAAPVIGGTDGKDRRPVEVTPGADAASARIVYADGFVIDIDLSPEDGAIRYHFDGPPADAKSIKVTASLPLIYLDGGAYSLNGGEPKPFPAEPDKQLFAQGTFTRVDFLVSPGNGLSLEVPVTYQQLQDNRVWKTRSFSWIYHYDLLRYPESKGFTFRLSGVR